MNKNIGRVNLVTRFICAECGSQLNLSYDGVNPLGEFAEGGELSDGITGAYKLEQRVSVLPCGICIEKYKKPLEDMQKALSTIKGIK